MLWFSSISTSINNILKKVVKNMYVAGKIYMLLNYLDKLSNYICIEMKIVNELKNILAILS